MCLCLCFHSNLFVIRALGAAGRDILLLFSHHCVLLVFSILGAWWAVREDKVRVSWRRCVCYLFSCVLNVVFWACYSWVRGWSASFVGCRCCSSLSYWVGQASLSVRLSSPYQLRVSHSWGLKLFGTSYPSGSCAIVDKSALYFRSSFSFRLHFPALYQLSLMTLVVLILWPDLFWVWGCSSKFFVFYQIKAFIIFEKFEMLVKLRLCCKFPFFFRALFG